MSDSEKELIDKVATKIVDSNLEPFAQLLLQTMKPLFFVGGEIAKLYLTPYLLLLDEKSFDFLDTFEKRENVDTLLDRINYLTKKKNTC